MIRNTPCFALRGAAERVAERVLAEGAVWGAYPLDLAWEGILRLAGALGRPEWQAAVLRRVDGRGWTLANPPGPDWRSPFASLDWALAQATGDPGWVAHLPERARREARSALRAPDGCLLHPHLSALPAAGAVLLDRVQAYATQQARAGHLTGEALFFQEALEQWRLHRARLRDPVTGLWRHGQGWDPLRPDGLAPAAWSRGHGWLARGLNGTLEALPESDPGAEELRAWWLDLFAALERVPRREGLWPTLLDHPLEDSPPETSGSGMLAAEMARAARAGWLPADRVRTLLEPVWGALAEQVGPDGAVHSVCPGPGPLAEVEPYRVAAFAADDPHGAFAVLFAAEQDPGSVQPPLPLAPEDPLRHRATCPGPGPAYNLRS